VLALDFDGVICDSLEEGPLVAWNAHAGTPFAARYDELPRQMVGSFIAAARRYHSSVRRAYADRWLAHVLQPGIGNVLANAYIVTPRDSKSGRRILVAHATIGGLRRAAAARSS
jgi:hypothetical protein